MRREIFLEKNEYNWNQRIIKLLRGLTRKHKFILRLPGSGSSLDGL